MSAIRWGVLGASSFAKDNMAPAIHAAKGADFVALATSSAEKALGFQAYAPNIAVFTDYDAMLADPGIDAVYIPLPNHMHVPWTVKALEAGKHVLCEKPIAMQAHDPAKGGGALPDIGVYPIGAARYVSGQEPQKVTLANLRYEHGVDVFAQVAADFDSFSFSAIVSMRMMNYQQMTFHGTTGVLRLTCPFNANKADVAELVLDQKGAPRMVERWPAENHYVKQVEAFCAAVRGKTPYPVPLEWSRGTQEMLDSIYAAGGRA